MLENTKSCLTWDGKSANGGGGQKAEKCIALSPDMGALFNWSQRLHSWGSFSILFFVNFLPIAPINPDSTDAKLVQNSNYNGVDKRFNGTVGASLLAGVKGQIAKSKLSLQTNQSRQKDDFSLECVDEVCLRYADNKQREKHNEAEEEDHKISEV